MDDAEAVLLFGSRARGDHRPDSDWDMAVITRGTDRIRPPAAFGRLPGEVNVVAMPLDRLRRRRNDAIWRRAWRARAGRWRALSRISGNWKADLGYSPRI